LFTGLLISTRLISASAAAGDEPVFSGPQPGEPLTPLPVVQAYGDDRGKTVDLAETATGKPTLLVIVNGANRPAARLTRALLNYAEMRSGDGLFAALVWLDADRSAAETYLNQAVSWWGLGVPVGISLDGAEGPGSYGLNRNVNVTVLVANENRIVANYALIQPSETDAPKILADVVRSIGGDVPQMPQVTFLSLPTRKLAGAPWSTGPQDVTLRRQIYDLMGAADAAAARDAAARIDQYLSVHPEMAPIRARVADALTKGRTNVGPIPAMKYLRSWKSSGNTAGDS
jgi:hypothetical protein